jgi:hypothetical protein
VATGPTKSTDASATGNRGVVWELISARSRNWYLERDLSVALHLFYSFVVSALNIAPDSFSRRICCLLHAKLLQLPQGCPIGKRLIDLDKQFGGLLETKGILLERWVYEPREKPNGSR